jgi:hypothetical protein
MKYPVQPQALPSQAHKLKVCLCLVAKLQITVNDRLCQTFSFETNNVHPSIWWLFLFILVLFTIPTAPSSQKRKKI